MAVSRQLHAPTAFHKRKIPTERNKQETGYAVTDDLNTVDKSADCTIAQPIIFFIIIWFVRLLALRPLLAYCASLG
jgi:hypothetical protein